ncbi:hypothetical protein GGH95_004570 [Coemansia sp. RSA 1836]|nr:hypothetical protein GGH95_004570 [Coemansia sp. RSA 1836]
MIVGYGTTRDTLSLYSAGDNGVAQMSASVPDEVVFGFIMFEGSGILITHVSHKISGVQRARGLAHQKTIATFFSQHDVTVNTSKPSELTPAMLRDRTRHLAIKSVPMKGMYSKTMPQKPQHITIRQLNTHWHFQAKRGEADAPAM